MSGKLYEFIGVYSDEMTAYLKLREAQGHKHLKEQFYIASLDKYLVSRNISEKTLTSDVVEGWIQSLPTEMSVNTKIVYISHYSQFTKFLNTLGFAAFIPERPIDDKSYSPYVFSEPEIERIFIAADNICFGSSRQEFGSLAFPLIMRILYGCGLRLNEALGLKIGDVDTESGILSVHDAKGNKDRLVPMDASLTEIVRRYIISTNKANIMDRLLFENSKGEQYTNTTMRAWFKKTLERAKIEKPNLPRYSRNICLHCFRHTFAVHSFRKQDLAGTDMHTAEPFLSTYMGHHRFNGTETYLHMTAENSIDIIEKVTAYSAGLFPEVPK